MLNLLIAILGIIITILLVVGIHEFGHFLAARACGVKVLRFSIGFGKALFRWHDKKGTEYVLAAIPLGGYVKMLDEGEGDVAESELPLAFNRQPIYKKMIIVACGPIANLIFAFVIYWFLFVIGFSSPLPIIGQVVPSSIAEQAGLKPQQEVLSINNEITSSWLSIALNLLSHAGNKDQMQMEVRNTSDQTIQKYTLNLAEWKMDDLKPDPLQSLGIIPYEPEISAIIGKIALTPSPLQVGDKVLLINDEPIKDWFGVSEYIYKNPEKTLIFTVERQNKRMSFPVAVHYKRDLTFHKYGYLGVAPHFVWPKNLLKENHYNVIAAIPHAMQTLKEFINMNFITLGKILSGKISLRSLGGPITIFESAGVAINQGGVAFLSFIAFLSISIGIINILPIPGLDGGHIFFQLIELIIRRPISQQAQALLLRLGLIMLLLLISQAFINDILRMMS